MAMLKQRINALDQENTPKIMNNETPDQAVRAELRSSETTQKNPNKPPSGNTTEPRTCPRKLNVTKTHNNQAPGKTIP